MDDAITMSEHGNILIRKGAEPWPHERYTAEALCAQGYDVEFLPVRHGERQSSADVRMDGCEWEMKSPISGRLSNVQKTLRKAAHQSCFVIYDSQRVKNLTDFQIERELRKQAALLRSLKRVIFVTRKRDVIDIK